MPASSMVPAAHTPWWCYRPSCRTCRRHRNYTGPAATSGRRTLPGCRGRCSSILGIRRRLLTASFAAALVVVVGSSGALADGAFVGVADPAPYGQEWSSTCEAAATSVALGMLGIQASEGDIMAQLPIDPRQPEL